MLKFTQKAMAFICLICMMVFPEPVYGADESGQIALIINDAFYADSEEFVAPQVIDDRVYVPLRLISLALGYDIQWLPDSHQIVIKDTTVTTDVLPNNMSSDIQIIINGEILEIPADMGKPFVADEGYTMVPLRVVGTALKCEVVWESGLIILTQHPIEQAVPPVVSTTDQMQQTAEAYSWTIMGEAVATQSQMEAFLADKEKALRQDALANGREFIPYPTNIVPLYLDLGKKYNIRGDIALAQAAKETRFFQYGGSVQWFQNNYCGLGATGIALTGEEPLNGINPVVAFYLEGFHGLSFSTPAFGVEAHLQHLYAYATTQSLPTSRDLVDPRFQYVQRGISPRWIDLNGRWAIPGDGYGESILDDYWRPMLAY